MILWLESRTKQDVNVIRLAINISKIIVCLIMLFGIAVEFVTLFTDRKLNRSSKEDMNKKIRSNNTQISKTITASPAITSIENY